MKTVLLGVILLFGTFIGFSQSTTESTTTLFAQCMIEIQDQDALKTLEDQIKLNPYVKNVRLDYNTQRVFILTKDIETLSEIDFTTWFSQYSTAVRCIQIGVFGVDKIEPFPFENCTK